jgi:hypothetical protein
MIRYMLAALLVLGMFAPSWAAEPAMKADAAYGVRYAKERVVSLPQDQHTPYLTLFGDRDDPKFQEMVSWFQKHEMLRAIKDQTHFNVLYSDTTMYQDRYASTVPALPCVRLQAMDNPMPVAEYSGLNVPMTADALAKGLNTQAKAAECFRRRRRVEPDTEPPPFIVDPLPQPLSPVKPVVKPKRSTTPTLLLVFLCVAGGVLGALRHFQDVYRGR